MNIAIVTPYADPEKGACPVRVNSFKNHFEECGHTTTVVAPVRANIQKGTNEGIRYRSLRELLSIIYKGNFDVVIGVSTLLSHVFFVLLICNIKRTPFILDAKEPFTHTLSALDILPQNSMKFRVYKLLEKLTYGHADKIFVLTSLDKKWAINSFNIEEDKIAVVMNGVDPNVIKRDNEAGKKIREYFSIPPDVPVLIHIGGLGDEEVEQLLRFSAEEVVDKHKGHFLFVVSCDETPHDLGLYKALESFVKELNIEKNFHAIQNVEYLEMYRYLSAADIGVVPWPNALIFSLPVKIFEYMACELPILAKGPKKRIMYDFFKEHPIGHYATNWSDFKVMLIAALDNLEDFKKWGGHGRLEVEQYFSREKSNEVALEEVLRCVENSRDK